jgi:hypothetical protein
VHDLFVWKESLWGKLWQSDKTCNILPKIPGPEKLIKLFQILPRKDPFRKTGSNFEKNCKQGCGNLSSFDN